MSDFVGLHVHSELSFLDGYARVEHIAKRAKELGQSAVALTDHGEVNGHLLFQKACQAEGVKPLLGMEGYWCPNIELAREQKLSHKANSHITLLAADNRGLKNLWAWSSLAYEKDHFYYRPLADPKLMREYGEGIYASDGCMLTDLGRAVERGDESAARQYIGTLLQIFGDRLFMELHTFQIIDPVTDKDKSLNQQMTALNQVKVRLAKEFGVPLVVVNDAHYAPEEHWKYHRLVWDMNTKSKGDQAEEKGHAADWMMGDEELIFWMSKHGIPRTVVEEAIKNTQIIANACNAEHKGKLEMPRLTASESDDMQLFLDTVETGFKRKVEEAGLDREVYFPRMEEEVRLIVQKKFAGYFNLVADATRAAKSGRYIQYVQPGSQLDPLLLGPGRGSAGGSLVAYLMDITALDPIKYDLLFSRFISPGRHEYPDIDVDFPQSKRPLIKEYVATRHGHDHVCGIGTRNRMGPKQTLRDLARAMGISFQDSAAMGNLIEDAYHGIDPDSDDDLSWADVLDAKGGELGTWAGKYPDLFNAIPEMVGLARHSGQHAAGILIASQPLLGNLPTRLKSGVTVTQFDMWEVEELGALKFDALGIRHLDTLMVARELIQQRHGMWLDYENFGDEEYRDPDIWDQIDQGDTLGIFQLETAAGTRVATAFRPRSEMDVAELASVNRPGVIDAGLLPVYLRRRAGQEEPRFDHPLMRDVVGQSQGILVYQEQLMKAVKVLAGWSDEEAETLRKYVGKKMMDKLIPLEGKFVADCLANPDFAQGITENQARSAAAKVWTSLQAAGRYAFNRSHAMGYALIATWEIYTRHHYFLEFLAALLTTDEEGRLNYLRLTRKRDIMLLPLDINESLGHFSIVDDATLRWGLLAIRGVGETAVGAILEARQDGPFEHLGDYLDRVGPAAKNKGVVTALIKIGAFDFCANLTDGRNKQLDSFYAWQIQEAACKLKKWAAMDQIERGEYIVLKMMKKPEDYPHFNFDDQSVLRSIEKELTGTFVTDDPMADHFQAIERVCIQHPSQMEDYEEDQKFKIGGQITAIRHTKTKQAQKDMAIITIEWAGEQFRVLVFPKAWATHRHFIEIDAPVACTVIKLDRGACHLSALLRLDYQ